MSVNKSVYSLIGDLYDGYGEVAKGAGCAIVGAALTNPEIVPQCLQAANKVEDVIEDALDIWNKVIGKESSATLGTRILRPGITYKGNLFAQRQFLTPTPYHGDTATVRIEEEKGKKKTTVKMYLIDPTDMTDKLVGQYLLNEDKDEKKDIHQVIYKRIPNAEGKFVFITLEGPLGTNRFKYTLKLS